MRSWVFALGVAACAALTRVVPAQPDEAISRPVTLQALPSQPQPQAQEAVGRQLTLQYLPARRPPPLDEVVARAFTVTTLGIPLAVPSDSSRAGHTASSLHGPAPNPFRRVSVVRYALAAHAKVRLCIYDLTGRVVRALVMNEQEAGEHVITWNGVSNTGQRLAPGVYLCRLEAGSFDESRRIVLTGE